MIFKHHTKKSAFRVSQFTDSIGTGSVLTMTASELCDLRPITSPRAEPSFPYGQKAPTWPVGRVAGALVFSVSLDSSQAHTHPHLLQQHLWLSVLGLGQSRRGRKVMPPEQPPVQTTSVDKSLAALPWDTTPRPILCQESTDNISGSWIQPIACCYE